MTTTAALLSAPRMVSCRFTTTPFRTSGSIGPVGGTVSRCAFRKMGTPSTPSDGGSATWMFPMSEPIRGPASSSVGSSPRSRRKSSVRSATGRSRPDGLGIAASSRKRSRTGVAVAATAAVYPVPPTP